MVSLAIALKKVPEQKLVLYPSLSSGLGSEGYDSRYKLQRLGWPWTRNENGTDKYMGVRRSALGDGNCLYHTLWSSVGKLRKFEGSSFFMDKDFIAKLDYVDVDYGSPDEVKAYALSKDPQANTLIKQRNMMVDRWRNDLFEWLKRPVVLPDGSRISEEQARQTIINDPDFMKIWMKHNILNPGVVKFTTTRKAASAYVEGMLRYETGFKTRELDRLIPTIGVESKESGDGGDGLSLKAITYTTTNVTDADREMEVEEAIRAGGGSAIDLAWAAAKFDEAGARDFLGRLYYGRRGLVTVIKKILPELMTFSVLDELNKALLLKLFRDVNIYKTMKASDTSVVGASLTRQLGLTTKGRLPRWLKHKIRVLAQSTYEQILDAGGSNDHAETARNQIVEDLDLDGPSLMLRSEVLDMVREHIAEIGDPSISAATHVTESMNWGVLSSVAKPETTVPMFLRWLNKILESKTSIQVKVLLESYLTGRFLALISEYINARHAAVTEVANRCGFHKNVFTHPTYPAELINSISTSEEGWNVVRGSVDPKTMKQFTSARVAAMKAMDPRKIMVGCCPLAKMWVKIRRYEYDSVDGELSTEMMKIPLNTNYYMTGKGWVLKGDTYERSIESLSETLPIGIVQDSRGIFRVHRTDAGDDIIPYLSLIIGINISIVMCYHGFVWIHTSGSNPDRSLPYIYTANQGGHYEVFGVADSTDPRGFGYKSYFQSTDPFVQDALRFSDFFTQDGVRFGSADRSFEYLKLLDKSSPGTGSGLKPIIIPGTREPVISITGLTSEDILSRRVSEVKIQTPVIGAPTPTMTVIPGLPSLDFLANLPEASLDSDSDGSSFDPLEIPSIVTVEEIAQLPTSQLASIPKATPFPPFVPPVVLPPVVLPPVVQPLVDQAYLNFAKELGMNPNLPSTRELYSGQTRASFRPLSVVPGLGPLPLTRTGPEEKKEFAIQPAQGRAPPVPTFPPLPPIPGIFQQPPQSAEYLAFAKMVGMNPGLPATRELYRESTGL